MMTMNVSIATHKQMWRLA